MAIRPIILAGGVGQRLAPLSSPSYPKFLLTLGGKKSLIERACQLVSQDKSDLFAEPVIITNQLYRSLLKERLGKQHPLLMILEPQVRNTAASVALALSFMVERAKEDIILILPSDHIITDEERFHSALRLALKSIFNHIMVFGIMPSHPSPHYGYIEKGQALTDAIFKVKHFIEKPSAEKARDYIDKGQFFWNAGIFLADKKALQKDFLRHAPDIWQIAHNAFLKASYKNESFYIGDDFNKSAAIPFDKAVMEKTNKALMMEMVMGWSDIGSFYEITRHVQMMMSQKKEKIRHYDWGCDYIFDHLPNQIITMLCVNPQKRIDSSAHKAQSATHQTAQTSQSVAGYWVMVEGVAHITSKRDIFELKPYQKIDFDKNAPFQLENKSDKPIFLIEGRWI